MLCCPNEILSCSGEILSYRNNFIMLFEQDNKLYKRDLKSFEQHIVAADNSTLRITYGFISNLWQLRHGLDY